EPCAPILAIGFPSAGFQKRAVPSAPQVARTWPFALNTAPVAPPGWAVKLAIGFPSAAQSLTLPSRAVAATVLPSGETATAVTAAACASSRTGVLSGTSQTLAVLSVPPDAI